MLQSAAVHANLAALPRLVRGAALGGDALLQLGQEVEPHLRAQHLQAHHAHPHAQPPWAVQQLPPHDALQLLPQRPQKTGGALQALDPRTMAHRRLPLRPYRHEGRHEA